MSKKNKPVIKIGGDVIISKNQSGGTTAKNIITNENSSRIKEEKRWWEKQWFAIFTIITGLATILGFLGFQFHWFDLNKNQTIAKSPLTIKNTSVPVNEVKILKDSIIKAKTPINQKRKMFGKEKAPNVTITGDVVNSYNQTGGITAHTVNQYGIQPRLMSDRDFQWVLDKYPDRASHVRFINFGSADAEMNSLKSQIIAQLRKNGYNDIDESWNVKIGDVEPTNILVNPTEWGFTFFIPTAK